MQERIKILRKAIGLSQTAFGARLGVSRDVINNIEHGRAEISEMFIKLLCHEFNINEKWLRDGVDTMFNPTTRAAKISAFIGDVLSGDEDVRFRTVYFLSQMSDKEWDLIADFAEKLTKKDPDE